MNDVATPIVTRDPEAPIMVRPTGDLVLEARQLDFFYGKSQSLYGVDLPIERNKITALIGPSGCGKSTLLRTLNKIYDLYPGQNACGRILLDGKDLLTDRASVSRLKARDGDVALEPANLDTSALRARIGMVFQKPTPFPMSIYDNVAFGVRLYFKKSKAEMDQIVERSLRRAALWDEVKTKLHRSGLELSGGQQQRLCIARTVAVKPEVILLDEPASALDPLSTAKIEELIDELQADYTIVIVTHNMQQAARVSRQTAFMYLGELVEFDRTEKIFTSPREKRTQDYITGRFG